MKPNNEKFPEWKPQKQTLRRIKSPDYKTRLKALRNSSSGFIKREDVRNIVFALGNGRCAICHSCENLQVDHIRSVYSCAKGKITVAFLNSLENLQPLCGKCNSGKLP